MTNIQQNITSKMLSDPAVVDYNMAKMMVECSDMEKNLLDDAMNRMNAEIHKYIKFKYGSFLNY